MDVEHLIEGLTKPDAYPEHTAPPVVVHTHISVVFLTDEDAYKIKKPINLGFLDFTTLEARQHFCREEVRLNRRLAPDVYLGVVPITASGGRLAVNGEGDVVEYAVHMRRLPDDRTFESLLTGGALDEALLERLADRMAAFHASASSGPEVSRWGGFETVAGNARENFEQVEPYVGETVSATVFERLRGIVEADLNGLRVRIDDRAARHETRDTHGDLHLKHVYSVPATAPPGDLLVVDCIEFNERFRFADPVADIAFLAMDLRYRGRPDLADSFCDAYFEASGDTEGRALLPYYVGYRAIVRGKVDGFAWRDTEIPLAAREAARDRARAYFLLALGVTARAADRPAIVLSVGLPGTGKSWMSAQLVERYGFTAVATDRVRKELAGVPATTSASAPVDEGIYSAAWSDRTYEACLRKAVELLEDGRRVVVDGTFREVRRRAAFVEAARSLCVPVLIFENLVAPETARARIEARRGDASDAYWGVYEAHAAGWQDFVPAEAALVTAFDSDQPHEHLLAEVEGALRASGLA